MKKLLIVLIILAIAASADAYTNPWVAGCKYVATACNYSVCSAGCKVFDWDCSTDSMASNVCVVSGDSSATAVPAGTATEVKIDSGTIVLVDTNANGADYYKFDISGYDLVPQGEKTIQMTINMSTITSGAYLLYAYFDANNYIKIILSNSSNDLSIQHVTGSLSLWKVFDVNLSTGVEYQIIIKFGEAGISLSTNGGSSYVDYGPGDWGSGQGWSAFTHATGSATGGLRIGNYAAVSLKGTIDNVIISGRRDDL